MSTAERVGDTVFMSPNLSTFALSLPLRWLPDTLHTQLLARALNHLLRGQLLHSRLPEIDGRTVCIDIIDTKTKLHFQVRNDQIVPSSGPSQVAIRGNLRDFVDLATRREDADTLFFNRRLCIEGDTDTGLHIKNLLDSLQYDWQAHLRDVLPPVIASRAINVMAALPIKSRRTRNAS